MEEYIYKEEDYIKPADFSYYHDLIAKYDYNVIDIQDEKEFDFVLTYLLSLTERAKDFIPAYEYASWMLNEFEPNEANEILKINLEQAWFDACMRVAKKEDIFNKKVEWSYMENRPLIRGLYFGAQRMWKEGMLKEANELFNKILKTNGDDNIGARYAVKATGEGMSLNEFEAKFTKVDESGSYFKTEELWAWFGKE